MSKSAKQHWNVNQILSGALAPDNRRKKCLEHD
ncbi:MAG: hypothetical protein ACI9CP_001251 [Cryomorphaceae bacterium]